MPAVNGPFVDTLIGGVSPGEGNVIAHNNVSGISVVSVFFSGNLLYEAENISILGNSIYSNSANNTFIISESGLGIDLMDGEFSDMSSTTLGPTPNDSGDGDSGPNNFINFPIINSASQNLLKLNLNLDLDVADSPTNQYRVEIFANDSTDPSGYGEGQSFLGC